MSKPLRVLQVFASLNVGGAECRMMDVYRNLDKEKVQFDFITMSDEEQFFEKEIKSLGGEIYKIGNPRERGVFSNTKSLITIMKMKDYVAVHAHTSYHCGIVSLAAKIAGIDIRVAHARTTGTIQKGLLTKLNMLLGKFLINFFATERLCISKISGDFLFGKNAVISGQATVIPNAINLKEYENVSSFDKDLNECLVDNIVIGHIGRFSEMKNHKFLVEIYKQLKGNYQQFKLVLVGDGLLKGEIEKKIHDENLSDSVIFTGQRRDIPYLLSLFDVLVIPSIYEGLGGVVIEAQAAGIPCVVSDVLPDEIDIGLDIIKRVSLEAPIQEWINAIQNSRHLKIKDRVLITQKFEDKKYTIEQEINYLLSKIYCI